MEPRIRLLASTRLEPQSGSQRGGRVAEEHTNVSKFEDLGMDDYRNTSPEAESCESEDSDDDADEPSDSSEESSDDIQGISSTSSENKTCPNTKSEHVSSILEAQLSPDGTCVFTSDHDRTFSVYIINADILETDSPRKISPHARFSSSEPIRAFAAPPWFALDDWQRAPVLISRASKYITWHKALYGPSQQSCDSTAATIDISATTASYKLIDHLTEEVIAPHSLAFTPDGKRFLAGSKNQISLFDINITNGPIQKIRTIPSTRSKLKDGGVGYKGTVSALGMAPSSGMFASGTWSSHVALHRVMNGNVVQLITHFPLPRKYNRHMFERERIQGLRGHGVSQLKFSPCENYLYIAERLSDAILIYDVRNVSLSLGHCAGRNAHTIQKFGFDICSTPLGHEVWAGGVDGMVRVWKDPYGKEGSIEPDFVLPMGQAPVSSTIVHPCGNLAITATGRIDVDEPEEDEIVQRTGIYPRHTGRGSLNLFELGSSTDEVVQWE